MCRFAISVTIIPEYALRVTAMADIHVTSAMVIGNVKAAEPQERVIPVKVVAFVKSVTAAPRWIAVPVREVVSVLFAMANAIITVGLVHHVKEQANASAAMARRNENAPIVTMTRVNAIAATVIKTAIIATATVLFVTGATGTAGWIVNGAMMAFVPSVAASLPARTAAVTACSARNVTGESAVPAAARMPPAQRRAILANPH